MVPRCSSELMEFSFTVIAVRNFIFHTALIVSHECARNKREERQQEFAYVCAPEANPRHIII